MPLFQWRFLGIDTAFTGRLLHAVIFFYYMGMLKILQKFFGYTSEVLADSRRNVEKQCHISTNATFKRKIQNKPNVKLMKPSTDQE
jgi:hypothetical protein